MKVWIVARFTQNEGYLQPEGVFSTLFAAQRLIDAHPEWEENPSYMGVDVLEFELDDPR